MERRATGCTKRCASSRCCGSAKRTKRHAARSAHLSFYSRLCRFSEVDSVGAEDVASKLAWLDALDLEADNIRAALRHCLADPDGADLGLAMAAGLGQYWRTRAVSEGAHWIDALLDRRGGDDAIRR